MKKISYFFAGLAILLTNIMVAFVAYNFGVLKTGIELGGYSAPVYSSFLYVIPFIFGIIACIVVSFFCRKHSKVE